MQGRRRGIPKEKPCYLLNNRVSLSTLEREKRLELSTYTLARYRSTN